jgi:hypothetical protein
MQLSTTASTTYLKTAEVRFRCLPKGLVAFAELCLLCAQLQRRQKFLYTASGFLSNPEQVVLISTCERMI